MVQTISFSPGLPEVGKRRSVLKKIGKRRLHVFFNLSSGLSRRHRCRDVNNVCVFVLHQEMCHFWVL